MSILAWIIVALFFVSSVSVLILSYIGFTRQRIGYQMVGILKHEGQLAKHLLCQKISEIIPWRHRYIFARFHSAVLEHLEMTGLIAGDTRDKDSVHITARGLKAAENYHAFLDRYLYW